MRIAEHGKFRLTPVSPVNIGSGEKLSRLDFCLEKERLVVKDVRRYLSDPKIGMDEKMRVIEREEPERVKYDRYSLTSFIPVGARPPREIVEFIKGCDGRPFIPGSSLKGAIRSALAWKLAEGPLKGDLPQAVRKGIEKTKRTEADEWFDKKAFRSDPVKDSLKCLILRDSPPLEPGRLSAYEARVFNSGRNIPIYLEALRPDEGLCIDIDFFYDLYRSKEKDGFSISRQAWELINGKDKIRGLLKDYCQWLLSKEVEYFDKGPGKGCPVKSFYEGLLQRWERGEVSLPLGFGTGWHMKTVGKLLAEEDLERLKGRHMRSLKPPHPQTRKVILIKSEPRYPIGWVKVEVI